MNLTHLIQLLLGLGLLCLALATFHLFRMLRIVRDFMRAQEEVNLSLHNADSILERLSAHSELEQPRDRRDLRDLERRLSILEFEADLGRLAKVRQARELTDG